MSNTLMLWRICSKSLRISNSFSLFDKQLWRNSFVFQPRLIFHKRSGDSKFDEVTVPLSRKDKLKRAVRDYGSVVIVFHVGISLLSLGGIYLAVANGFDLVSLLKATKFSEELLNSKIFLEGSTFVIAYAIHKVFAPVRIAVTLSTAPFIVRYLRKVHILKTPKTK